MNEIWVYGCEDLDDYFDTIDTEFGNSDLDRDDADSSDDE